MATRASRNRRLIETRQSPIPFTGPLTPSPQSGTQVKTPEVQGLFNAPANVEAQNAYRAMGNLGNTLSQTGQALQQRKIKARQLNMIDNRTHDFLLRAEVMDKRLHRMMVTRVFDPSRGEIGPERQRPKFQLDPSQYETEYKKGLKLLQEQAVDGLLDKDGTPIDPVAHRGITDSVNTYLRDKIPEMLSFATKMEIGKIEGDWERNIRDAMQAAQDGVLNTKAADTHLAKAYERGLELARTGAFPKGESEVRGRIAALAKEWMTSEVLDARSVEQLEGILKSQQYRWMPREVIESRIKTLKKEERDIRKSNIETFKFQQEKIKKRKVKTKNRVYGTLYGRYLIGEYKDPVKNAKLVTDSVAAVSLGVVKDTTIERWRTLTPLGLELAKTMEKKAEHIFFTLIKDNTNIDIINSQLSLTAFEKSEIDKELSRGEITEEEAKKRRKDISEQEEVYLKAYEKEIGSIGELAKRLGKDVTNGLLRQTSAIEKRLLTNNTGPMTAREATKIAIGAKLGVITNEINEYMGVLAEEDKLNKMGERLYPDKKPTPVEKQGAVKGQPIKPTPIKEGMGSELFGPKDPTPEQLKELEDINEHMKREGRTLRITSHSLEKGGLLGFEKTNKKTRVGRPIYYNEKTGENISEVSATRFVEGKGWVNFPTIYNGTQYIGAEGEDIAFGIIKKNKFIDPENNEKLKFYKTKEEAIEKAKARSDSLQDKQKTKEVYDPEHDVTFIEDETKELRLPSEEPITITFDELLKSEDYKDNVNWDDPNDINQMAQIMKQEINEGRIEKYNVTDIPKDIDKAYQIKGKKKKKMSKAEDRLRTFLTKNEDALRQLFEGNKQLESKVNELLNRGLWSEVLKLLKQELNED